MARRGRRVLVAKQLPDHEQRAAGRRRRTGEGMPQIVQAHVIDAGHRTDAPPGLLEVHQVIAVETADDDLGIALDPGEGGEDFDRGIVERERFLSGF